MDPDKKDRAGFGICDQEVEARSKVAKVSSSGFAAVASSQWQSQAESELSEDTVDTTTSGAQPLG